MEQTKSDKGKIIVKVYDTVINSKVTSPVVGAKLRFYKGKGASLPLKFEGTTDSNGRLEHEFDPGDYTVTCDAMVGPLHKEVYVEAGCSHEVSFPINVGLQVTSSVRKEDCTFIPCGVVASGTTVKFQANVQNEPSKQVKFTWRVSDGGSLIQTSDEREVYLNTADQVGEIIVTADLSEVGSATISVNASVVALPPPVQTVGGGVAVTMRRTATAPTTDLPLWVVIRKSTEAISFDNYEKFMDLVLCGIDDRPLERKDDVRKEFEALRTKRRFLPYNDVDAYRLLKVATEAFLMVNCAVFLAKPNFTQPDLDDLLSHVSLDGRTINLSGLNDLWNRYLVFVNGTENRTIPYLALIRDKLRDVRLKDSIFAREDPSIDLPEECFGILRTKLTEPCLLELIWSYWHEEGMLVQTLNAISVRFQNIQGPGDRDPLAMLEIDPLRPLNNLIWGYIQDEQHRLSVRRRAYEYDHHYGMTLQGKAVPTLRPADSRSKFLEAFHNLLYLCAIFFKEDDDTTVIADGFPVLNALKEVHFLLTEGAHNQFGDLPSTARQEMLVQQWLLARPEFREFLPTRIMVAYPEPWMDRVDAMKKLQGWTDAAVRDFHSLAVYGEQILLSIRYGAWSIVNDPVQAANFARFWRAEIQGYTHSYRGVTGVDLTAEVTDTRQAAERFMQPSVHLVRRLAMQQGRDGSRGELTRPTVPARERAATWTRKP